MLSVTLCCLRYSGVCCIRQSARGGDSVQDSLTNFHNFLSASFRIVDMQEVLRPYNRFSFAPQLLVPFSLERLEDLIERDGHDDEQSERIGLPAGSPAYTLQASRQPS